MLDDVLPRPHHYPSFVISDSFAFNGLKYALESEDTSPEAVAALCEQYLAGTLQPSRKSEPVRVLARVRCPTVWHR